MAWRELNKDYSDEDAVHHAVAGFNIWAAVVAAAAAAAAAAAFTRRLFQPNRLSPPECLTVTNRARVCFG